MDVALRHKFMLGPLGRILAIHGPGIDRFKATPDLGVTVHKLISGKVRTSRAAFTPRTYGVQWRYLTDTDRAWIEYCALGYVPGPHYLIDPTVVNQLPPNVSAPTGEVSALTATSGAVTYRADGSQGFGGVDWVPSVANAELRVTPRSPYVAGLPFTGSVWVTRYSGLSTTAFLRADWYDIAGVALATTSGSAVTLATIAGAYQLTVTTSSPPAGAVEGRLAVVLAAARTMRVDSWQVEYGTLSASLPGPGVAKVSFLDYDPDQYLAGTSSPAVSMVEVA